MEIKAELVLRQGGKSVVALAEVDRTRDDHDPHRFRRHDHRAARLAGRSHASRTITQSISISTGATPLLTDATGASTSSSTHQRGECLLGSLVDEQNELALSARRRHADSCSGAIPCRRATSTARARLEGRQNDPRLCLVRPCPPPRRPCRHLQPFDSVRATGQQKLNALLQSSLPIHRHIMAERIKRTSSRKTGHQTTAYDAPTVRASR
jgi:hypothetical protein